MHEPGVVARSRDFQHAAGHCVGGLRRRRSRQTSRLVFREKRPRYVQQVSATPRLIGVKHMKRGRGLSELQRRELWRRWKEGQSLSDIGRALGKHAASVFAVAAASGGFPPALRKRAEWALTLDEREEISRGVSSGSLFGKSPRRSASRRPRRVERSETMEGGGQSVRPRSS